MAAHGELVDRLMQRIGELESRLHERELADSQFTIAAFHGAPVSPRTAAATSATQLPTVNRQLLDSLGDPEKQAAAAQPQARDWRAAASSWLAASPLARSALNSLTAATSAPAPEPTTAASRQPSNTGAAAAATAGAGAASGSARRSEGPALRASDEDAYAQILQKAEAAAAAAAGHASTESTSSDLVTAWSLSTQHPAGTLVTAAAPRSPRASASTVPAASSSANSSFSFQPKQDKLQQESSHAVLHGSSTASHPSTAADSNPSMHHHSKSTSSNSDNKDQKGGWSGLKSYYRYIMAPAQGEELAALQEADVQNVQEAAGAALAEANERLLEAELRVQAAQAAQRQLQQRLEAAEQLQQDVENLKTENLEAWQQKYELEGQLVTARANMEGMQGQASSMQKELEDLRQQAQIWCASHQCEGDKLKAEVELLNGQLLQRSAEVSSVREQLTEARAERDRALQERQQALDERDRLLQQMQQVSHLQQQLALATAAAADSAASAAEFQEKFIRERAVRRRLHEQLQVLRGNIRVMCRVRPVQQKSPSKGPGSSSSSSCITVPLEGLLVVNDVMSARQREFEFDACFSPDASQQQVFEEVSPLVRSCADGYNVCIFAYGQTGSGKTFTMEGPADNPGINSRALQELFKIAAEEGEAPSPWSFSVSMMEIYNEAVRDLLALATAGGSGNGSSGSPGGSAHGVLSSSLDVSGLPAGELPPHMDRVPGLVWRDVRCAEDVTAVLHEGWRARATAATALNAASSRSHALLCVKVRGVREGRPFTSLLYLVDLAGSERVDKSEVTGQQLKEAQAINKSLSSLGDVIAALQRRSPHIPFRNSKLTQVLQDSLCGSSKVLLVCNLSPEAASCGETLSSLNFASRAAQVELGQARRVTGGAAAAAAPAAGTTGSNADVSGGGSLSPEPSSSSLKAQSPGYTAAVAVGSGGGADARGVGAVRAKSPVYPTSPASARVSAASSGGGASPTGAAAGTGVRPGSRLSERTSGVGAGLASSGGSMGSGTSPRVSMAKPARH